MYICLKNGGTSLITKFLVLTQNFDLGVGKKIAKTCKIIYLGGMVGSGSGGW